MSKPKSNSVIEAMPQNQRDQLEAWLFEENISYKDAVKRLLADFEVRAVESSVGRFYQRCAQLRMLDRIAQSRSSANAVVEKFQANPADMYSALTQMVGQIAFEKAMGGEFDPEMLFNFTKIVMTARKQDLEAQTLALSRDKFQFDVAKAVRKHLSELQENENRSDLDDDQKMEQVRLRLFGEKPK